MKNLLLTFTNIDYILFTSGYKLISQNGFPFKVHHNYDGGFYCTKNVESPSNLIFLMDKGNIVLHEEDLSKFVFSHTNILFVKYTQ